MRSLITSIATFILFLGLWYGFMTYCEGNLYSHEQILELETIMAVKDEEWDLAEVSFQRFSDDWHHSQKVYTYFLDENAMRDTDFAIAKASAFITQKETSLALGELYYIKEQIKFLYENERIKIKNIF